jgi:single-stranded DNA-binding protein
MNACVNRVTLLGRLNKRGVEVRYANGGTPCASFTVDLTEQTTNGQWFTTYVDCECWGKKAEAAGEIDPGALVLFEGKLKRQKRDEKLWVTLVSGFELVAVATGGAHER